MVVMIEEDYQAWQAYQHYRWMFNKLEVARRFGYHAGPSGVPIEKPGYYIVRPTYNLYGMGIGAKKIYLDPQKDSEDMIALAHVPPGYFWCEYLHGDHISIDFSYESDRWVPFCAMRGVHQSEDDSLVRFEHWEKIEPPQDFIVPQFLNVMSDVQYLNLEMKGTSVFEIHLRSGNDVLWDYGIGTIIYPIWENDPPDRLDHLPFVGNLHEDSFMYSASGHLQDNVRVGYRIQEPA